MSANPDLIVFHDVNVPGVYNGIVAGLQWRKDYELHVVADTRVAYATKAVPVQAGL